ncbi:hypothetical protein QY97_03401 [Bacillus thermotolerans]|uniref:Uncharacterized protein n=1 Tax=Bacillus thermotolerans TaxID=1221996 RepID=A0A0F5HXL4_BACTR|nr:hypothetical protein QY97_03401 [Bacillus thermotolerans]KKB40687.1 hypothetical protein QY95_01261 [Bacillus thermotolerans]
MDQGKKQNGTKKAPAKSFLSLLTGIGLMILSIESAWGSLFSLLDLSA